MIHRRSFVLLLALAPMVAHADPLDAERAIATAFERSPTLTAAREAVREAEARLVSAGTYPLNPVLGLEAGARRGPSDTAADVSVELAQGIELAGQTGKRETAAAAELRRARAEFEATRRSVAAQIRIAFVEVLRARAQAALAGTLAEMSAAQVVIVEKRLAVGDATRLDLNLARAEAGRAGADHAAARGVEAVARAMLATLVGADDPAALEVRGELTFVATAPVETAELRRLALTHRAELEATRQGLAAAQARVRTSEAATVPDLDVGAFFRREGSEAHIFGGLLGVPLPIFGQARAEVDVARAELRRQTASAAETRQRIEQEVLVAAAERTAAVAAAQALERHVALALDENLRLLQRAFEAGEIGGSALHVARRAFRESGRDLIEALAAAERARIRLELATGTLPVPPEGDVR
jgi:cobalt-zinc-cadmium efflux system outer membrane protein